MNCIVCTLYCVDYFTEHNLRVIHFVVCIHNAFVFNLILSQFHFYTSVSAAAAVKSLQSCPTLCNPRDSSPPGSPSLGFSRQEFWSGLQFPFPMHESEKWKWSRSVVSDSSDPMDCSLPGSSIHGIFQARVLEWGGIYNKLLILNISLIS